MVEEARRLLAETSCAAVLWIDGLFGDDRDLATARGTSGRIGFVARYSQFGGIDPDGRVGLQYELPNLERRIRMFLDRADPRETVEDRGGRFSSVRSSFPPPDAPERWVAGLGVAPPGRWRDRADFRAGVRPSASPSIFAQARVRQLVSTGDWSEWRFRQSGFWESRAGFGVTAGAEYGRLLTPAHFLHWTLMGTVSEASEGVEWRGDASLHRKFSPTHTLGGQLFGRGATSAAVPFQEIGFQAIYRRPLGHPTLIGEFVVGYSWPREDPEVPRRGSAIVGLGLELHFGRHSP